MWCIVPRKTALRGCLFLALSQMAASPRRGRPNERNCSSLLILSQKTPMHVCSHHQLSVRGEPEGGNTCS
ncbi:hypothetical protein WJX82_011008 [Trebouxia sp. C0006]